MHSVPFYGMEVVCLGAMLETLFLVMPCWGSCVEYSLVIAA